MRGLKERRKGHKVATIALARRMMMMMMMMMMMIVVVVMMMIVVVVVMMMMIWRMLKDGEKFRAAYDRELAERMEKRYKRVVRKMERIQRSCGSRKFLELLSELVEPEELSVYK